MPGATLHLTHAEILSQEPALYTPLREAMQQELVYSRLGSVFHDLGFYTNIVKMMLGYWLEMPAETCPFAQKLHRFQPDAFAWHLVCAAQQDGLLTREQRLAFVGGFFSHVALDLELHPLVNWISRREVLLRGGHESHHHRLAEKYHSLFFHRDLQGRDALGQARFFFDRSRIVEHPPFFRVAIDQPIIRWATEMLAGFFHEGAPSQREFCGWVRAFRHFGFVVSLPWVKGNSDRLGNDVNREHFYENDEFRFLDFWERGYGRSVRLLNLAYESVSAGDASAAAGEAFRREAAITDLSYPPEQNLGPLPDYRELELSYGLVG